MRVLAAIARPGHDGRPLGGREMFQKAWTRPAECAEVA